MSKNSLKISQNCHIHSFSFFRTTFFGIAVWFYIKMPSCNLTPWILQIISTLEFSPLYRDLYRGNVFLPPVTSSPKRRENFDKLYLRNETSFWPPFFIVRFYFWSPSHIWIQKQPHTRSRVQLIQVSKVRVCQFIAINCSPGLNLENLFHLSFCIYGRRGLSGCGISFFLYRDGFCGLDVTMVLIPRPENPGTSPKLKSNLNISILSLKSFRFSNF